MNSLTSKILTSAGIVLIGGASLISGCTKILYDHPVDRFIMDNFVPEALQPPSIIEERRKAREKENQKEVIYNTPPEHVVLTHDGMWRPEEGYTWANPEPAKNNDYRVRKVEKKIIKVSIRKFEMINLDTNEKEVYEGVSAGKYLSKVNPYPKKGFKVIYNDNTWGIWVRYEKGNRIGHREIDKGSIDE